MRFNLKIILIISVIGFASKESKAQGYINKKATATQTFSLRLTKPAATQLDIAGTASKFLAGVAVNNKVAGTDSGNGNFTVTEVTTEVKDSAAAPENRELVQQNNDKIQIITLSKA